MAPISPRGPLLALDTGTPVASVAVLDAHGAVLAQERTDARNHGPTLLGTVEQTLSAAHLARQDLVAVACGRGPGSFTGLRIGLATAKGICFALDIPLLLPSSLEAMALQVARAPAAALCEVRVPTPGPGGEPGGAATRCVVLPCLDARRKELFAAAYRVVLGGSERPERRIAPMAAPAEAVAEQVLAWIEESANGLPPEPVVLLGNGVSLHRDVLTARLASRAPRALVLPDAAPQTPEAAYVGLLGQRLLAAGEVADLDAAEPEYLRPSDAELNWQKRFGGSPEQTGPGVLGQAGGRAAVPTPVPGPGEKEEVPDGQ